ncbi:hypothetical protein LDENG_00174300, partial [Lucifuga dentata]
IIDPFVEVEVIGVPVDCCKEQTRVVDDNGFNPMWEETLVFTVHMPELALIRFLVWDHDPIGQDFIGQRTIAFNSMMPGYRHVYLEGMEEASIFVHVAVNDITGKTKAASGIKGLFHRSPKQASLDSHAAAQHGRKHPFGAHLLRRTASAPTKGQPKIKKGFPETATDTKDYSSEGASEEQESKDRDQTSAAASQQASPPQQRNGESLTSLQAKGPWDRHDTNGAFHHEEGKGKSPRFAPQRPMSEPLKRASRLRFNDPLDMKPGVFARVALNSSGKVGMSSNCITCVTGLNESPETQRKAQAEEVQGGKSKTADSERQCRRKRSSLMSSQVQPEPTAKTPPLTAQPHPQQPHPHIDSRMEAQFQCSPQAAISPHPFSRCKARQTLGALHIRAQPHALERKARSFSVPRRCFPNTVTPAPTLTPAPRPVYESRKRAVGTLQREMNALFAQKMEELRNKSPMFFAGKMYLRQSSLEPPA